jgi:hypothetical protein
MMRSGRRQNRDSDITVMGLGGVLSATDPRQRRIPVSSENTRVTNLGGERRQPRTLLNASESQRISSGLSGLHG